MKQVGHTAEIIEVDPAEARLSRMRRSVLTTARLITDAVEPGHRAPRCAMVTLTYREGVEWEPRHVSDMLRSLRRWAKSRGLRIPYVWVAELTRRGRMHYHLLLWLPHGVRLPMPDRAGWWPHGMSRIEWARSAVGYVSKYVSKGDANARYPRGARIFGSGGLDAVVALVRRWWMLPSWVRRLCQPSHDVRRAVCGGWVSRESGEWWRSIWGLMTATRERVRVVRIADPPPPLDPLPPASRLEAEAMALRDSLLAAS